MNTHKTFARLRPFVALAVLLAALLPAAPLRIHAQSAQTPSGVVAISAAHQVRITALDGETRTLYTQALGFFAGYNQDGTPCFVTDAALAAPQTAITAALPAMLSQLESAGLFLDEDTLAGSIEWIDTEYTILLGGRALPAEYAGLTDADTAGPALLTAAADAIPSGTSPLDMDTEQTASPDAMFSLPALEQTLYSAQDILPALPDTPLPLAYSASLIPTAAGSPLLDADGRLTGLVYTDTPKDGMAVSDIDTLKDLLGTQGMEFAHADTRPAGDLLPIVIGAGVLVIAIALFLVLRSRRLLRTMAEDEDIDDMDESMDDDVRDSAPLSDVPAVPAESTAPSAPRRAVLTVVDGPARGLRCALAGKINIGRDAHQCQMLFPPDAPTVSRMHCAVSHDPSCDFILIEDLSSRNGTYLADGRRLPAGRIRRLPDGARFYLGEEANTIEVRILPPA